MAIMAVFNQQRKEWITRVPWAEVYTIQEVAIVLGQANPMVYSYIHKGKITAYKIDGVMHVKHKDLMAFVKRHRLLRQSLDAKVKPQRVVPTKKGDASVRQDFSVPLAYVD